MCRFHHPSLPPAQRGLVRNKSRIVVRCRRAAVPVCPVPRKASFHGSVLGAEAVNLRSPARLRVPVVVKSALLAVCVGHAHSLPLSAEPVSSEINLSSTHHALGHVSHTESLPYAALSASYASRCAGVTRLSCV